MRAREKERAGAREACDGNDLGWFGRCRRGDHPISPRVPPQTPLRTPPVLCPHRPRESAGQGQSITCGDFGVLLSCPTRRYKWADDDAGSNDTLVGDFQGKPTEVEYELMIVYYVFGKL